MNDITIEDAKDKLVLLKRASRGCVDRINEIRLEYTSTTTTTDTNGNEYEVTTWSDDTQRQNSYELNEIRIAYDAKAFKLEKALATYQDCTEEIISLVFSNTTL